uniref:Nucleobase-ascorbate transporter 4 n=1 Tax=Kalanchoe fedtschenkoi TaxID=63787 RepID=A0A7N0T0I9_KALFE
MAVEKADELVPHPVKDQLPGVDFCVTSCPNWAEAVLLGFQHYLVMLGAAVIIPTILVPEMGGGNYEKAQVIQTLLFVSGINTLLQSCLGTRLPVVMGGSFAFIIPTLSIARSSRYSYYLDPHERFRETMRGIQGSLMVASVFPVLIGFLGFWRIAVRYISPLAAVPLVTLTGLGLFRFGFPQLANCVEIGLPGLLVLIIFSQYVSHGWESRRAIFNRFAVLISVVIVWVFAEILTVSGAYRGKSPLTQLSCRTDRSGLLSASPWIRVPYPFQWGRPCVNAGDVFAYLAAIFVALVESMGTFIAASRFGSATPVPPSILSRGAGWQGIGILLGGMFGTATGFTASVENAGLVGLTRVGSRRVVQISAAFMLFFSVLGKFGALLASIPLPIVAALYCLLFAYVSSAGLGFLQFCNLNSFRTKFILGFSLFMGLSVPQYFIDHSHISGHDPVHTRAIWFNDIMQVIFTSSATVGFVLAYFLDCTLARSHSRRDSGRHWWAKFRYYDKDSRSEEFYALPFNLNKFFPSL